MFATGIQNNIKSITTAVTNIANEIKKILGIPPQRRKVERQRGPLTTAGTWMSNLTTQVCQWLIAGIPNVTTATTSLATAIGNQFVLLNQQVDTSTTGINNNLMLLNTNVQTQTNNVSGQFSTLNANVSTATANINANINNLNTTAQTGFNNVARSAQTASSTVTTAGGQISSSTNNAATNVQTATSKMNVSFGNTAQYATQTVQTVSKSAQEAQDHLTQAQGQMSNALTQFGKGMSKLAAGMGQEAGFNFTMAFQNAADAARSAAMAVAAQIQAILGHSKPKEGPLVDDDVWGKHMMENIAGGMIAATPLLTDATDAIATTLASVGTGPQSPTLSVNRRFSATPSSSQPMIIYNVLDGKKISKAVMKYQQREIHVQGNVRGA
jgi:hypothetical protein